MLSGIPKRDMPVIILFGSVTLVLLIMAIIIHWGEAQFFGDFVTNLATDFIGAFTIFLLIEVALRR